MQSKIISHSLKSLALGFVMSSATPATEQAYHVTVVFGDMYGDIHHGNHQQIAYLANEVEDTQLQLALTQSVLEPLKAQEEACAIADLNAAKALSIQDFLNHQIGGDLSIPIDQRLQALFAQLGLQNRSLGTAVAQLTVALEDIEGDNLSEKINRLLEDKNQEAITKRALQRLIAAQAQEQQEARHLIDDILQQQSILLPEPAKQEAPKAEEILKKPTADKAPMGTPLPTVVSIRVPLPLSSYQQDLLSRRHQIGDVAWKWLSGENPKLAAALAGSIQQNLGTVEILSLERSSFNLFVDGKRQRKLYRF